MFAISGEILSIAAVNNFEVRTARVVKTFNLISTALHNRNGGNQGDGVFYGKCM